MAIKENEDMARREEPTKAPTPDKLDRAPRSNQKGNRSKPYPLTEEEATPNTPASEQIFQHATTNFRKDAAPSRVTNRKKRVKPRTTSDYNKYVSHPRTR